MDRSRSIVNVHTLQASLSFGRSKASSIPNVERSLSRWRSSPSSCNIYAAYEAAYGLCRQQHYSVSECPGHSQAASASASALYSELCCAAPIGTLHCCTGNGRGLDLANAAVVTAREGKQLESGRVAGRAEQ